MKKLIPALLLLSLVFAGCGKDDPAPAPVVNYQPMTANSTWTYNVQDTVNASNSYSYTLRATGTDTSAGGKTYKVFTNSVSGNEYYMQSGANYYQFGSFEDLTNAVELNYLRTDVAAGATWEETKAVSISGFSVNASFKYTMVEKLATYVVNTITYTDVLHVKIELTVPGLSIQSQDLNFYYANGVGRVRSNISLKVPFISANIGTVSTLTSSTIVP